MRIRSRRIFPAALSLSQLLFSSLSFGFVPRIATVTSVNRFVSSSATQALRQTHPRHRLVALQMSTTSSSSIVPGRPTWQQTMIRVKDPSKSLAFYTDLLGFTLIDKLDFPQYSFTVYFLTTLPQDQEPYTLTPGTRQAHEYLWSSDAVMLELTHNHGTEKDESQHYHVGNQEKDGFGHIAVK